VIAIAAEASALCGRCCREDLFGPTNDSLGESNGFAKLVFGDGFDSPWISGLSSTSPGYEAAAAGQRAQRPHPALSQGEREKRRTPYTFLRFLPM
jgi:hypothetical protein